MKNYKQALNSFKKILYDVCEGKKQNCPNMHLFAFVDVDRVVYCDVYKTDRPQPFIDIGAVHPKVYKAQHPIQQKFIHGEISFDEYKRMVGKLFDDEIWKEDIKIEND